MHSPLIGAKEADISANPLGLSLNKTSRSRAPVEEAPEQAGESPANPPNPRAAAHEMADDPTTGGGDRGEDVVRAEVSVPCSPAP